MIASGTRLRALTALVTAWLMVLSLSVPALAAAEDVSKTVPWDEMEYVHDDPAPFNALAEDLTAAGKAGEKEEVLALYDELYDQFILIFTHCSIAGIHNDQDVTDEYWADEMVYSQTLATQLADTMATACHEVLEGPCGDALAEHIGDTAAEYLREYEPQTPRELELAAREAELLSEYSALMDTQYDTVYVYDGEDWDLTRLSGEEGAALTSDVYSEILNGIFDILCEKVVPIYTELVAIRTEEAQINGYDNYNQYAYEELYCRSYTPEQAMDLIGEVKELCQDIYYSPVLSMTGYVSPSYDDQEAMLEVLHTYTGRVDPVFDETWQFMVDNGLCDVAAGSGRSVGAYTTELPAYGCSFIYGDEVGDPEAMTTFIHEFGHFTAGHLHPAENFLTGRTCLDVAEIQSTGLELLVLPFYDEIYRQGADIARYYTMYRVLCTVTDQALFAEFEARIYEDPESYATKEALNTLYSEVSQEFGYYEPGPDPTWITIPHFFESPDYVISYVTAGLAAMQIWAAAQEDWQAGVDIYMDIERRGSIDLDYFEVLDEAGLKSFATPGVAAEVCGRFLDVMAELEGDILSSPLPAEQTADATETDITETDASDTDTEAPDAPAADGPDSGDVLDVQTQGLSPAGDGSPTDGTDVLAA